MASRTLENTTRRISIYLARSTRIKSRFVAKRAAYRAPGADRTAMPIGDWDQTASTLGIVLAVQDSG